jgi:putative FmdB family regulatory protein
MPTYEFACQNGHRIEVFQRIGDTPLTACEVCGAPLRKVFHPAGILFKGSGFYSTDSRSKAGANKGGSGDEATKSSGDGSGSSESAPSKDAKGKGSDTGSSSEKKTPKETPA